MKNLVIYDKASYHYTAENYPQELLQSQAFVHTGFFLGWLIKNNLISDSFKRDWSLEVNEFLTGNISGPKLFEIIDGTLTTEDLNDEGNSFALNYFNFQNGKYLQDYEKTFSEVDSLYAVEDTPENFERISRVITNRYQDWRELKTGI